jgi:dTDP-glucose pyrophosphorylase
MINLIPLAGKGNRFFLERYNIPKPFIPIQGQPMIAASIGSFPKADTNILICLNEHVLKYKFGERLSEFLPNAEILAIDGVTEGQACTCLLAEKMLHPDKGLFIASCDYQTLYDAEKYQQLLENETVDVIIWTFKINSIKKSDPRHFAYCRVESDRVLEVVEKKIISDTPHLDHAVVGSFTYKTAGLFVRGAKQMIKKNIRVNNEFYVGTSINQLIQDGCKVVVFEVDKFISFGNPFELKVMQFWEDYFNHLEDHPYSLNQKPIIFI